MQNYRKTDFNIPNVRYYQIEYKHVRNKSLTSIYTLTGLSYLRHRVGDYRHFNFIDDNIAGNYVTTQADFIFLNVRQ